MPTSTKRIVIIGATSLIAEHCARLWLEEAPARLTLVARDTDKAERIASDLGVRSPASDIDVQQVDFTDPAAIQALAAQIVAKGSVDIVLIAQGTLPDQAACQTELAQTSAALMLNGLSPVLFAEAFAGSMQTIGHGTLIVIGSVAGDRGRRSNYVYGAAKGLVARYVQGLQHRLAGTGVKVVMIKPGPTDTPMTSHLKQQGVRLAPASLVARDIVRAARRGRPVVYTPKIWALIMMIVRYLPAFVFNRMDV